MVFWKCVGPGFMPALRRVSRTEKGVWRVLRQSNASFYLVRTLRW